MKRTPMTVKGAEKLKAELQTLKSEARPQVIAAIAEARAHGDLKENAEYHAAKEQQGFIEGRIAELIPAANTGSRSFEIKAEVAFDEQLLPGLYARLLLPAGTQERLLIPGDKIARIGQLDLVWVVSGETLQRRIIRTGKTLDDGSVEILSGLRAGEQVADRPLLDTD